MAKHAEELGYFVKTNKLFTNSLNPINPTAKTVIKKNSQKIFDLENYFTCPITKGKIERIDGVYFGDDIYLLYPIIINIPIFLIDNAVLSFHFDKIK